MPSALCPSPRKYRRQLPRRSAGPGLAVLGVPVATLGPQRRALGLGKCCRQRGQVGGRAGERATPAGLGGALQTEPRAAPPPRACCPAHAARPHQQPVARVALEVLLPADGAVILTCGKRKVCRWLPAPGDPRAPKELLPVEGVGPRQCLPGSTGDHCRQIPVASDAASDAHVPKQNPSSPSALTVFSLDSQNANQARRSVKMQTKQGGCKVE